MSFPSQPQPPGPQQPFGSQQPFSSQPPGTQHFQQPGPPGYHPQPGYGYPPPKKHTLRNVLIAGAVILVLLPAGCLAVVGVAANEVSESIEQGDTEAGAPGNPVEIAPGEAFEVRGFNYLAGWQLSKDQLDLMEVTGLRVTNNRDSRDSALVEIKVWQGSEVVALANCTTEPIAPSTTTRLSCLSTDKLPNSYDKITINDSF